MSVNVAVGGTARNIEGMRVGTTDRRVLFLGTAFVGLSVCGFVVLSVCGCVCQNSPIYFYKDRNVPCYPSDAHYIFVKVSDTKMLKSFLVVTLLHIPIYCKYTPQCFSYVCCASHCSVEHFSLVALSVTLKECRLLRLSDSFSSASREKTSAVCSSASYYR